MDDSSRMFRFVATVGHASVGAKTGQLQAQEKDGCRHFGKLGNYWGLPITPK